MCIQAGTVCYTETVTGQQETSPFCRKDFTGQKDICRVQWSPSILLSEVQQLLSKLGSDNCKRFASNTLLGILHIVNCLLYTFHFILYITHYTPPFGQSAIHKRRILVSMLYSTIYC